MALNHTTIEKYLPKYDGDRDTLKFFIEQVTLLARTADADARVLFPIILKSKLRGEAIKAVAQVPNSTVEEIIQGLQNKFGDNRTLEQIMAQITCIKRQYNETPVNFANKIKEMLYAAKNKSDSPQASRILENLCINQLCKNLDINTDRLIRSSNHLTFDGAFNQLEHEIELHAEYFERKVQKYPSKLNETKQFNLNRMPTQPARPWYQSQPPAVANGNRPTHWTAFHRPTSEQWRKPFPPREPQQQRVLDNSLDTDVSMRTVSKLQPFKRPSGSRQMRTVEVNNTAISEPHHVENSNENNEFFQEVIEENRPV